MRILILVLVFLSYPFGQCFARIYYNQSMFMVQQADDAEDFSFRLMSGIFFIGATVGDSKKTMFGQDIIYGTISHQADSGSTPTTMTMLELGPRITHYFNEMRTFGFSLAYHLYAKGTRTLGSTGDQDEVSGSSVLFNIVYQLRVGRRFYAGASINVHYLMISESIVNDEKSQVSQTYTTIFPAIDFSIRFK